MRVSRYIRSFFILILCAFSLSARADDCKYCEILLAVPSLEPELECVRFSFAQKIECQCKLWLNIYNECSSDLNILETGSFFCGNETKCQTLQPGEKVSLVQNLLFFEETAEIQTDDTISFSHAETMHELKVSTKVSFWEGSSSGCNSAGSGNPLAGAFWMMAGIVLVGRLRRRASKEFVDNYQSPEVL